MCSKYKLKDVFIFYRRMVDVASASEIFCLKGTTNLNLKKNCQHSKMMTPYLCGLSTLILDRHSFPERMLISADQIAAAACRLLTELIAVLIAA